MSPVMENPRPPCQSLTLTLRSDGAPVVTERASLTVTPWPGDAPEVRANSTLTPGLDEASITTE